MEFLRQNVYIPLNGLILRRKREKAKKRLIDLANATGISVERLLEIETGKRDLTIEEMKKLKDYLAES